MRQNEKMYSYGDVVKNAHVSENIANFASAEDSDYSVPEFCEAYARLFDFDAAVPQIGISEAEKFCEQISDTPDMETQLYIVKYFPAKVVQKIITRFHLYACAEVLLLKRGCKSLLEAYFRNNFLHNEVQELLVKAAVRSEAGVKAFNLYISRRSLCPMATWTLIKQKNDALLTSYLKRYRLGSRPLMYVAAANPLWSNYLFPLLVYPQDKLALLLMLRVAKSPSKQEIRNWACCYDAGTLLRELPEESCFELEGQLRPEEELVLTEMPDKYLLENYIRRYRLAPATEAAIIRRDDTELFNMYTHHSSLSKEVLRMLIKEHNNKMFAVYIQTHRLSDNELRFLEQYGSQEMIDEYFRRRSRLQ